MVKKKKSGQEIPVSSKAYLKKGNVRKLPVYECLIPEGWEKIMKFPVIVARKHVNGNITFANLLVDLLCTGIKDAFFAVNIQESSYLEMVEKYYEIDLNMIKCDYALVHNVIYEALAYAKDFGIEPHKNFTLAEKILEEDDERIPLMDIRLGYEQKPLLILHPDDPRNDYYLRKLEKNAGKDNFIVSGDPLFDIRTSDDEAMEEEDVLLEDWSPSDWKDYFEHVNPEKLTLFDEIIYYLFERCIYEPEITGRQKGALKRTRRYDTKITYEPVKYKKYSRGELAAQEKIYNEFLSPDIDRPDRAKIILRLKVLIDKWPDNPVFYNYLCQAYNLSNQRFAAETTAMETMNKFPEYIFGKLTYAQMLLGNERTEEIPAVFNDQYSLPAAFPGRDQFHISEYIAFNTIMSMYFFYKNDIVSAYSYYRQILEVEIPENLTMNEHFFMKLKFTILEQVKSLVRNIQNGKLSEKEIITLLMTK